MEDNNPEVMLDDHNLPPALIVEDDKAAGLILQNWLRDLGYRVVLADDGQQAWSAITDHQVPKLILLDWSIPGLDGIELCRRIRAMSWPYYPYVVMIAGRSTREDVAHALESGADDYLAKPFDRLDLEARLKAARRILTLQDTLIADRNLFRTLAMKDSLTHVWSRKAFLDLLSGELDRCVRHKTGLGLLFADLDHFKTVNDTYGHLVGDLVLREIAQRLSKSLRSYDFVGRYGGEEFCIALPGCPRDAIGKRAEMIRSAVCAEPIAAQELNIRVTLSIGVAATGQTVPEISELIATADLALYKAKMSGRNCCVYCTNAPLPVAEAARQDMKTQCLGCPAHASMDCLVKAI